LGLRFEAGEGRELALADDLDGDDFVAAYRPPIDLGEAEDEQ
jgi:hypothetical protein